MPPPWSMAEDNGCDYRTQVQSAYHYGMIMIVISSLQSILPPPFPLQHWPRLHRPRRNPLITYNQLVIKLVALDIYRGKLSPQQFQNNIISATKLHQQASEKLINPPLLKKGKGKGLSNDPGTPRKHFYRTEINQELTAQVGDLWLEDPISF